MKTTKKQDQKINTLTKKFGINENISGLENDGSYYWKSAYGNLYYNIQRNGSISGGGK